jgi:hypothetical protein
VTLSPQRASWLERSGHVTLLVVFVAMVSGCGRDKGTSPKQSIRIRVVSDNGKPVGSAHISGGDHDWFRVDEVTDTNGYAQLPSYAVSWDAFIQAADHFPITVRPRDDAVFYMRRTELALRMVGTSDVYAVKFVHDTIIHLDYNGDLVTFLHDEVGMTEVARAHVAPLRRQAILRGDTLWFTTHHAGVYAYDIADPANPRPIIHISIDEYLGPIALLDSLLIVANPWEASPIEIYVVRRDKSWSLLGTWGELCAQRFDLKDHVLMAYAECDPAFVVVSLDDPAHPSELFSWGNPYYTGAFRMGDSIVFTPAVALESEYYTNLTLDISTPAQPAWRSSFNVQGQLTALFNDTLGAGLYSGQMALFAGDRQDGYRVVALSMTSDYLAVIGGVAPRMIGDLVLLPGRLLRIVRE